MRTLTSAVLPATLVLLAACSGPSAPAGTPTATARTASATANAATTAAASPAASTPSGTDASGATGATGTPSATGTPRAATTAAPTTAAPPSPPPPPAGPTTVNSPIANFAFAATSGAAPLIVRWMNNDTVEHDIVGADGTSSPSMAPGAAYERRFNTAGTFSYTCSFHPFMTGTVTIR